ncbi:hypothetical protein CSQ89_07780 [Chitinimonas sp. BJB300]|nr:hypothetical protein CSQ89_07780 [Chitinimonas sp. BJB300]
MPYTRRISGDEQRAKEFARHTVMYHNDSDSSIRVGRQTERESDYPEAAAKRLFLLGNRKPIRKAIP